MVGTSLFTWKQDKIVNQFIKKIIEYHIITSVIQLNSGRWKSGGILLHWIWWLAKSCGVMGRFMWMIRGVAVEFAGQSVYPTMILRSSTAPLSLPLMWSWLWSFVCLFVCLFGRLYTGEVREVAVEFVGQSVYPTILLRSSTAPLSLQLIWSWLWHFISLLVCLVGHLHCSTW